MKRTYTILCTLLLLFLSKQDISAQFVVARDTIKGSIDFSPRLGDLTHRILVPNDSVFYMYSADPEIDPWRYVDYYTPSRTIERGYIRGTNLMRVDDYEMIEVERLSAHGSVSFRGDDVRVNVSVTPVNSKNTALEQRVRGYLINGKPVMGVGRNESPKLKYQSISVSIKGKNIIFPKKVYEHLLEPEIDNMAVYYNATKKTVYIMANNGGMAAPYNVLWVVSPKGVANVYVFDPMTK